MPKCHPHNIPEAYGETSSCPGLRKGWQPPRHSASPQISLSQPFVLQRPCLKHCSGKPASHWAPAGSPSHIPPHQHRCPVPPDLDMPHAQEPAPLTFDPCPVLDKHFRPSRSSLARALAFGFWKRCRPGRGNAHTHTHTHLALMLRSRDVQPLLMPGRTGCFSPLITGCAEPWPLRAPVRAARSPRCPSPTRGLDRSQECLAARSTP